MHIKISNKEFESQIAQNDDFCVFPDKKNKYINLSSQGDMRVESTVI